MVFLWECDALYESNDYLRLLPEDESTTQGRSEFRRDYGRLVHSASFRRLQGKTQLFPNNESDFFRNRLTHSIEVAQIAKGIALMLNKTEQRLQDHPIDLDLVEFAGLAHDLGHPPFGHNGERALDDCMKGYGGFEGNAQTLHILTSVEKKRVSSGSIDGSTNSMAGKSEVRYGLNVTYRSLASILKYDSKIEPRRSVHDRLEKGYYACDEEVVNQIKGAVGQQNDGQYFKTIECQIMDIADDIAYSTYDLEDAMKAGFVHPMKIYTMLSDEVLIRKIEEKTKKIMPDVTTGDIFGALVDIFQVWGSHDDGEDVYKKVAENYATSEKIAKDGYARSAFTSDLVGRFISGISIEIEDSLRFAKVNVDRNIQVKIEALKHLNYLTMIMSPQLKVAEYRGYEVVETIFRSLSTDDGYLLLPDDVQQRVLEAQCVDFRMRAICDFVSGMTDKYAVEFYERLKGGGHSIFKPF